MQSILMRQLRKRFKKLPRKFEARINATTNVAELQNWLGTGLRWLESTGPVPFVRSSLVDGPRKRR